MKKIIYNEKNIIKLYTEGMESSIYYYRRNSNTVFLKKLKNEIIYTDKIITLDDKTFENKRRKIELISEIEYFDNEVEVLELVYDENDKFIGYTMTIDSLKTADTITRRKDRIEILKLIREKMELFNENDIYIGDFNPKNIILTDNGIKFCDLDNFKIDELDFDLKTLFQNIYLENCNNIENIDNYSFNLFSICYIGRIFEPYIWEYLDYQGLPRKLNTKENRIILSSLLKINDNYEKKYLIDNMRKF